MIHPDFNPLHRQILKFILILPILLLVPGNIITSASQPDLTPAQSHQLYLPLAYHGDIDLYISAVKVIQGTTMSHGYQVYIADRETIVRVFVGVNDGSKVVGVSGELCGYNQNSALLGCVSSDNGSITAPSFASNITRTLNFTLPDDWLKPGYAYHVEINQDHHIAEGNKDNNRYPDVGIQPFNFVSAPALDVVVVPVVYQPFGSSESYEPEMNDYSYLTFFPDDVLPIPSANFQFHEQVEYRPSEKKYNLDTEDGWKQLLSIITSIQNSEDPNGAYNYYGLVYSSDAHDCDNGCIVGVANQGERGAVGWSGPGPGKPHASKTMTHELGHNFDRKHVLCQGTENNIDQNYPYPDGMIGVYGLNVNNGQLLAPSDYFDFMSYCLNVWTSDYTYWNIFQFRDAQLSRGSGKTFDGQAMYIRGMLSPEDQVTLLPVYRQTVRTSLPDEGPFTVDLLATYKFNMLDIADSAGHRHFGFFVPSSPETVGIRLREGDQILIEKSTQPSFSLQKSAQDLMVLDSVGDRTLVSWPEVSHPDEPVYYRLRLSKDGGLSWQVLALDWRDSSLLLPEISAVERNRSLLEIQASDGIHTSTQIYPLRLDR